MLDCMHCGTYIPDTAHEKLCITCWVRLNDDRPPCAWCYPGSKGNSIGSHGICQRHSDEMIAAARQPVSVGEWERSMGYADDYMPDR